MVEIQVVYMYRTCNSSDWSEVVSANRVSTSRSMTVLSDNFSARQTWNDWLANCWEEQLVAHYHKHSTETNHDEQHHIYTVIYMYIQPTHWHLLTLEYRHSSPSMCLHLPPISLSFFEYLWNDVQVHVHSVCTLIQSVVHVNSGWSVVHVAGL